MNSSLELDEANTRRKAKANLNVLKTKGYIGKLDKTAEHINKNCRFSQNMACYSSSLTEFFNLLLSKLESRNTDQSLLYC